MIRHRLYDDPELQAYVEELGRSLAARSERPDLPWSFKVLDDPAINAFALGGKGFEERNQPLGSSRLSKTC